MKIIHIIYDDMNNPWLGGGGARRTFEIYRRFAPEHSVTVLTGRYPKSSSHEVIGNVKYVRLGLPFSYLLSRISFAKSVLIYLLFHKSDVIVEDYTAFSPCFSFLFGRRRTVIASLQNLHSQKAAKGKGFLKAVGAEIFDRIAFAGFRYFTGVSPLLANTAEKRSSRARKCSFIGVGIDESLYSVKREPFTGKSAYALYFGRIEIYQKGIDVLLRAFAGLKNVPKLIFAGGGADFDKLRPMSVELGVIDRIETTGKFTQEQKLDLLAHSLFVVMPSRFEGYPVVPLEAMASGNAFIGTKIPGNIEVVGDNGILVEKDNVAQLRDAMYMLAHNAGRRKDFERSGREYSRKFTWASVSNEFEEFIKNCNSDASAMRH
jgi:glycosyltransferase involved in cell wall biosynthesis